MSANRGGADYRRIADVSPPFLPGSFLWKDHQQVDIAEVRQELADILIYAHMLLDKYGLDGDEIVNEKIGINEQKYPVDVSRGKYTKWNKL